MYTDATSSAQGGTVFWDLIWCSLTYERATFIISRLLPWTRRQQVPPKLLQVATTQHGVVSRKVVMFISLKEGVHTDKCKAYADRSV